MMKNILKTIKSDAVLCAALCLAVLSCFFTKPGPEYLSYIDGHTLILLFCLMLIMEGLREQKVFLALGHGMLRKVTTQRGVTAVLVFLCFLSSMLITNDVALITFVPFGIMILEMADLHKKLCSVVTLMTIGANLGSMFTPIGNPQNLYLFSLSGMSLGEFLGMMLPYTAVSAVLLAAGILLSSRKEKLEIHTEAPALENGKKTGIYLVLFFLCILTVAGIVPHGLLLAVVLAAVLLINPRSLGRVDYTLLFTFLFFFIFVGNIRQIQALQAGIGGILAGRERLVSVAVSQIISNVPAAMLLSGYTHNVRELIVGTNIGGLGTLIASMASLISYKQIANWYPGAKRRYLLVFTGANVIFLAALCWL